MEKHLHSLKKIEIEEVLHYYDELIQDAIDNGESEVEFIEKLGTFEDIVATIHQDEDLITRIREKSGPRLVGALNTTTRIIGKIVFAFLSFLIVIIIGSIGVSGVSIGIYSLVMMLLETDVSSHVILMRLGNLVFGIGLTLAAIGVLVWYFGIARSTLDKILFAVKRRLEKESDNNE